MRKEGPDCKTISARENAMNSGSKVGDVPGIFWILEVRQEGGKGVRADAGGLQNWAEELRGSSPIPPAPVPTPHGLMNSSCVLTS